MTDHHTSRKLNELRTMLDLKHEVRKIGLESQNEADTITAINGFGKIKQLENPERTIDEALACILLDPHTLLTLLDSPWGARLGYDKDTCQNYRYLIKRALKLTGAYQIINAKRIQRSPEWLRANDLLPSQISKKRGMQLASAWGSVHNVGPKEFSAQHIPLVEAWLRQFVPASRVRNDTMAIVRDLNRAVDNVPSWPGTRIEIAHRRDEHYSVKRKQWPDELHDEIGDIQAAWRDPDPDDLEGSLKPLAESNIETSTLRLYRALSAHVRVTGVDPATVKSPSVLVKPDAAKKVLDFQLRWHQRSKPDLKKPTDVHLTARLIAKVAKERHRHLLDTDDLLRLERMARVRRPKQGGMAKKNRALLNGFDDEQLLARFLAAPKLTFERLLEKKTRGWLQQGELMVALATTISMHAPLRPANMCALIVGEHVFRRSVNEVEVLQIKVSGDIVKNDEDLDFELSGEVVELYDLYMEHGYGDKSVEPLYLYRRRDKTAKSPNALSRQIARYLEREIGIYMTGHTFRHVTGYLYLKDNPGDYETVRQLLGHKDIKTTMTFYAAMDKRCASKRVNAFLEEKRRKLVPRIRRRRRSTRS